MKHLSITLILISLFAVASVAQTDEKAAVRVPLENYIKGHATGDGEYMRKAFHTEGNLIFVRDGKVTNRSFAEYIARPAATHQDASLTSSGNAEMPTGRPLRA